MTYMVLDNGVEREATPEEAAEIGARASAAQVPVVPKFVAMWQAREILIEDGLLDDVYAYFETISDPVEKRKAISKFDTSNTVQRDDPLVRYVIPLMGKSEEEIDQMFIRANAL